MAINIEVSVRDLLKEKLALRLSAKLMSGLVRVIRERESTREDRARRLERDEKEDELRALEHDAAEGPPGW